MIDEVGSKKRAVKYAVNATDGLASSGILYYEAPGQGTAVCGIPKLHCAVGQSARRPTPRLSGLRPPEAPLVEERKLQAAFQCALHAVTATRSGPAVLTPVSAGI